MNLEVLRSTGLFGTRRLTDRLCLVVARASRATRNFSGISSSFWQITKLPNYFCTNCKGSRGRLPRELPRTRKRKERFATEIPWSVDRIDRSNTATIAVACGQEMEKGTSTILVVGRMSQSSRCNEKSPTVVNNSVPVLAL